MHYRYLLHFFSQVKTVLKTNHPRNTIKIPNKASQNSQYSQLVRRQCLSDSWQCESEADRRRCPAQTIAWVRINIHYKAKQRWRQLHSGEIPSGQAFETERLLLPPAHVFATPCHHGYGDCLEVKREYYQNCSVLGCVTQYSQSAAHLYEQFLQVQQIGFVTLGPLRHA